MRGSQSSASADASLTRSLPPTHFPAQRTAPGDALLDAIGRVPTLTHIDLECCQVGPLSLCALARALRVSSSRLRNLRLFQPFFEPRDDARPAECMQHFFSALSGEGETKSIVGGGVGEEAVTGGSSPLHGSSSTATDGGVGGRGGAAPSPQAPANLTLHLVQLDLAHIELDCTGAAALGRCLLPGGALGALESFRLRTSFHKHTRNNCAVDEIAIQLCRALAAGGAPKLQKVNLFCEAGASDKGAQLRAFSEDPPLIE